MDTAVELSLSVFKDRLVERRVRIGASKEHQIDVRKASVIIIIILITSIVALCDEEESAG
jgi:hypothetical protein